MYLVDTNVWLELLLGQEKAPEVHRLFQRVDAHLLAITEFSLYSIGIILTHLKKNDVFEEFLSDTIEDSGGMRIRLDTSDLKQMLAIQRRYHLDFDDAYQYVAAERYGLTIISFDKDFDRTEKGRRTPGDLLRE